VTAHAPREHKAHAPTHLRVAVLTVSDSRTERTDRSGRVLREGLEGAGHVVAAQALVPDEAGRIRAAVEGFLADAGVDAVITTGGTGVAPRDVTIEALAPLFEKTLPGFGELFRALSFKEVGTAAYLSRAEAGVARGKMLFLLPGSPNAVELALRELILPELPHLTGLLRRPA